MTTDSQIGRNLARVRGDRSQKEVAELMRGRGFRWSQATVWAVEKGERPMRLTEAEALCAVLRVEHEDLLATDVELDVRFRRDALDRLLNAIYELAYESFAAQRNLADAMDVATGDDLGDNLSLETLTRTAVDVARDALARAAQESRELQVAQEDVASLAPASEMHRFANAFHTRVNRLAQSEL